MSVQDLYSRVTNTIISEIEAGNVPPWLQPWKSGKRGGIIPINAVTKKATTASTCSCSGRSARRSSTRWPSG